MNREERRDLRKRAAAKLKAARAYVLLYSDKDKLLQCMGDVEAIAEDKDNPSSALLNGMFTDAMSLTMRAHGMTTKIHEEQKQAEKVEEAKKKRSKEYQQTEEYAAVECELCGSPMGANDEGTFVCTTPEKH